MTIVFSADTIISSVVPTIQKFAYCATRFGIDASQVFHTASGLTPPDGYSYGRYFDSGDPLLQFQPFSGSIAGLIEQSVTLRAALHTSLVALVNTAIEDDISTALAPALFASFTALVNCCARPRDTISIMKVLAGFLPPPIQAGTDQLGQQISSLAALTAALIRVAALINLGSATALYTPTSSEDALILRNEVAALIQGEIALLGRWYDDPDVQALSGLRMSVVRDLNARATTLSPVIDLTLNDNLPSLVVAFRLYQDNSPDLEPDLVARNNPVCSGFLPLEIEALAS